ncbi:MAG: hypothetical protein F4155_03170 [Acidimicrobiales bacterium]|nr:hypothetical protein [Acidimicrobiales bacterium]MYH73780.1 hypothetical protein [Acidimicrobiales bacterium]MYK72951.1 hypothetical protein [Acidimicrobiales bacterium]
MADHPFDNEFVITSAQKEQFSRDGFVKLEGFLNDSVVAMLLDQVDAESGSGTSNASPPQPGRRFSNMQHFLAAAKKEVFGLIQRPYFQQALTGVTGRDLFLTYDLSFEIEKSVDKGLPWHAGVSTFGLHYAEDFGCTLWAPLHPIDSSGQRGGIACVPLHVLSAEFVHTTDLALVEVIRARERAGSRTSPQEYRDLRNEILNSPVMDEICDVHMVEYDFEPGDALLFTKNVVHRSIVLGEGELPRRAAYAMRFIDATSRYDLNRARTLHFPSVQYGEGLFPYRQITSDYVEIAEAGAKDGDLVSQCAYFSDRDQRTVSRTPELIADSAPSP